MRYFIVVVSVVILFAALYFWQCDNPVAVAQQPRQWRSGDTLWYEIDSVCPEQMDLKSGNGLARHRFALVLGKRRINFYISSGKAIDECDKIIDEYESKEKNTPLFYL